MQAFDLDHQPIKLVSIKIREELKDDNGLPDVYLGCSTRVGRDMLAKFSPELSDFMYKPGDQRDLDGNTDASSLRFPELGTQHVNKKVVGARFTMHNGIGEVNGVSTEAVSESTQVDSFSIDPQEGGTVVLNFRVWGKFTGPQIGNIALTLGRETEISIECPQPAQGSLIDGSSDNGFSGEDRTGASERLDD